MTTAPVAATAKGPTSAGPANLCAPPGAERSFAEVYSTIGEEMSSPEAPERQGQETQANGQPGRASDERQPDCAESAEGRIVARVDFPCTVAFGWPIGAAAYASNQPAAADAGAAAPYAIETGAAAAQTRPRENAPVTPFDLAHVRNLDLKTFLSPSPVSGPALDQPRGAQSGGEKPPNAAPADPNGSVIAELDAAIDRLAPAIADADATQAPAAARTAPRKDVGGRASTPQNGPSAFPAPARHGAAQDAGLAPGNGKRVQREPENHARDSDAAAPADSPDLTRTPEPGSGAPSVAQPMADAAEASGCGPAPDSEEPSRSTPLARTPATLKGNGIPSRESVQRLSLDIMKDTNTPVAVTMSNRAGRLSINVAAPDVNTLKDIERNAQALVERLQARGIAVDDVSVRVAPPADSGGAGTTASGTGPERRGERSARQPAQGTPRDDHHESISHGAGKPPANRSSRRSDLVV